MAKKVLKGWIRRDYGKIIKFSDQDDMEFLEAIERTKGKIGEWYDEENTWPPFRVTVTIEVED